MTIQGFKSLRFTSKCNFCKKSSVAIWEILFNIAILMIHHKLYSNGGGFVTTTYRCETPPPGSLTMGAYENFTLVWLKWLECTQCHTLDPGFESHQCLFFLDRHVEPKRLGCHAGHEEVSRGYTRGESEECR